MDMFCSRSPYLTAPSSPVPHWLALQVPLPLRPLQRSAERGCNSAGGRRGRPGDCGADGVGAREGGRRAEWRGYDGAAACSAILPTPPFTHVIVWKSVLSSMLVCLRVRLKEFLLIYFCIYRYFVFIVFRFDAKQL
jgi:hypothetical protein